MPAPGLRASHPPLPLRRAQVRPDRPMSACRARDRRPDGIDQCVARTTTTPSGPSVPDQAFPDKRQHVPSSHRNCRSTRLNLRDRRLFRPIKTVNIGHSGVNCQVQLLACARSKFVSSIVAHAMAVAHRSNERPIWKADYRTRRHSLRARRAQHLSLLASRDPSAAMPGLVLCRKIRPPRQCVARL